MWSQVSHGEQEASGNPISVGGETGDYALLLPRQEDLVGMRLHQALGDQFQAFTVLSGASAGSGRDVGISECSLRAGSLGLNPSSTTY